MATRALRAEANPVIAKLEAANALLDLAASLPPERQLDEIFDVGEEIVRAGFGGDTLLFATEVGAYPPLDAPNWPLKNSDPAYDKYAAYLKQLTAIVEKLPLAALAERLCREAVSTSSARAAYALWALDTVGYSAISSDKTAAQIVLQKLDLPSSNTRWSSMILLDRWLYAKYASPEQLRAMFPSLNKLAGELHDAKRDAVSKQLTHLLRRPFVHVRNSTPIPHDLQRSMAVLFLDDIMRQTEERIGYVFVSTDGPGDETPSVFQSERVEARRGSWHYFLGEWLGVVNDYLSKHASAPYDASTRDVSHGVYNSLLLYVDGDDWPVDRTADLFTDELRTYYTGEPPPPKTTTADVLPTSPAEMLAAIVHITGRLPEFARDQRPKVPGVAKQLDQWERFVTGKTPDGDRGAGVHYGAWYFSSKLFADSPHQAVEVALREAATQPPIPRPPTFRHKRQRKRSPPSAAH